MITATSRFKIMMPTLVCGKHVKYWTPLSLVMWLGLYSHMTMADARAASDRLATQKETSRLEASFATDHFVAYTPSAYNPARHPARLASDSDIVEDLAILRPHFQVLITYSCDPNQKLDNITVVAARLGFRVILGIWDVASPVELKAAVALAQKYPNVILGVLVGNETLLRGGEWETLERAFQNLRAELPGMPLSTSEPIFKYSDPDLRRIVDFHAPNIHWVFQGGDQADVDANVAWVIERIAALRMQSDGTKPILLKEHGIPSGPTPFTPRLQGAYWRKISAALPAARNQAVAFFEAFDLPWKSTALNSPLLGGEGSWGAWDSRRKEKFVVSTFSK